MGEARGLSDVPPVLVERLQHYFCTYKMVPGEKTPIQVIDAFRAFCGLVI